MVPMTAFFILLLSLALLCAALPRQTASRQILTTTLATFLCLTSLWIFIGYVVDLPDYVGTALAPLLPEALVSAFATKASPHTSIAIFLMALALGLCASGFRFRNQVVIACLFAAFALLWTILFAYTANAMPLYVIRENNQAIGMAPTTLFCLTLLLIGISGLRKDYDLMWTALKSRAADGLMARALIPIGLLIPLAWPG